MLIFLLTLASMQAQDSFYTFELGMTRTAMPFSRFPASYPQFLLGKSWQVNKSEKHKLFAGTDFGYLFHKDLQHLIRLNGIFSYSWASGKNILADAGLKLGYIHSFFDGAVYQWENNQYRKAVNTGNPHFAPELFLAIGYDLRQQTNLPVSIKLVYGTFMQMPLGKDVAVLPYSSLGLKFQWYINKNKN